MVFALLYLFPFVIQIGTSFKTDADATANPLNPIPSQFTTAAYQPALPAGLRAVVHQLGRRRALRHRGRVFFDSLAGMRWRACGSAVAAA